MSLPKAADQKTAQKSSEPTAGRSLLALCKGASDPLRLDILRVLSKDSFGVQELAGIFSVPQPGMSHHLKILAQCGLVETRREGNSIFYRRAVLMGDSELDAFQANLYSTIDAVALSPQNTKRMTAVHKERSLQSQEYFQKNASRFQEKQGLLCEPEQYFANVKQLLDLMELPAKARVMEVGPGEGLLLQELARRFQKVVALDNSKKMLELTRQRLTPNAKIEFVNSSLEAYSAANSAMEAIVLNMVLHHMPSPARTFQKLGQMVSRGGYVLVADLCAHDQEWTKASCGDVWQGFDPQELKSWAKASGFTEEQSSYLGLKNGFQIQLRLFCKE